MSTSKPWWNSATDEELINDILIQNNDPFGSEELTMLNSHHNFTQRAISFENIIPYDTKFLQRNMISVFKNRHIYAMSTTKDTKDGRMCVIL